MFALRIFPGSQVLSLPSASVRWTLAGKKRARISPDSLVFALLIFPGSHPPSIVSANELNFCVRDGNRWTLIAINTNSFLEEVFPFLFKAGSRISVIRRILQLF